MIKRLFFALIFCALSAVPQNRFGVVGNSAQAPPPTLGTRLRAAALAASSNPVTNPPMGAVAAWASGTVYVQGNIVSNGTSCPGSTACEYLQSIGTNGTSCTSAGSGGPTGVAAQVITDNTCSWYYYGPLPTTQGTAPTVTLSTSVPVALTTAYYFSNASGGTVNINKPGNFLVQGGVLTQKTGSNWVAPSVTISASQSGNSVGFLSQNGPIFVSFMTDAPKFTIVTYSSYAVRVIVDGQYVNHSGYQTSYNGGHGYVTLDFAGLGKARKITLVVSFNDYFEGVFVDPLSTVWSPSSAQVITAAFVGDSILAGGNAFPYLPDEFYPDIIGYKLGWVPVNMGIGGTGYIAINTSYYNFQQRLKVDFTGLPGGCPNIIYVSGGINDSNTGLQAAALATLQLYRSYCPVAAIIVTGVFPGATGPSGTILTEEASVAAAFAQWGDANSYYIGWSNNPNSVIFSGTGKITSTTATGNTSKYISSDGTHPTELGRIYLGNWMVEMLRTVIAAIP